MLHKNNFYVITKKDSEHIIAMGDSNQCAEKLGMTTASFYSMISKYKKGLSVKYDIEISEKH